MNTRRWMVGDVVKVEFEGKVMPYNGPADFRCVRTDGYGIRYVRTDELTLIEPSYVEPELRTGDRVAYITAEDDTPYHWIYEPSPGKDPFVSTGIGRFTRQELPEQIRILPPLEGSREAELVERIERVLEIAEVYGGPGPVARDIVKILRGEA